MSSKLKLKKSVPVVIKAGLVNRYKKGFLSHAFKPVYVELTADGQLIWYRNQISSKKEATVHLKDVCDYIAVGPYTRSVPSQPCLPNPQLERNLIAIPTHPSRTSRVYWFLCANDYDLNEWMCAINYVLPQIKTPPVTPKLCDGNICLDPPPVYSQHEKESIRTKTSSNQPNQMLDSKTTYNSEPNSAPDICLWGWTWGWGGGWGVTGWGCYNFGPCLTSISTNVVPVASDYHHPTGTDHDAQIHDQFMDCDHTGNIDGYDTGCDLGIDIGMDAGASFFDAGFTLGF